MQTPADLGPWQPEAYRRLLPYCLRQVWSSSPQSYHYDKSQTARVVQACQSHLKRRKR